MLQAFNVLRYEIGQRYVAHYDAFNPAEYGPQSSQRVYNNKTSLLLYNDLYTYFCFYDDDSYDII